MRILSQDGMIDVPYEQSIISIDYRNKTNIISRGSNCCENRPYLIAKYSTEAKAKRAMEMLRKAYSPILAIKEQENGIEPNIKPNEWVVGTIAPTPKVEVYDNFYFQFPADDELED